MNSANYFSLHQAGLSSGKDQLSVLNADRICGNYNQEEDLIAIGHYAYILQHAGNVDEIDYKIQMLAIEKFHGTKS